jgi:hypothetical protein
MYMYDTRLGDMDVEIEVPEEIRDSRIVYGYKMNTFEELSEEELLYLNDKYIDDILQQAAATAYNEARPSLNLLH